MLCFEPASKEIAITPDAPSPEWELKLLPLDQMKATAAAPAPKPQAAGAPGATQTANNAAAAPAAANGKKPAKGKAAAPPQQTGGFQRADVNASGTAAAAPAESIAPADAGGASEAMIVNGSVSNGIERRAFGNSRKGPGSMYRGDLTAVMDNSYLDARTFSLNGDNTPQPSYNHLKIGGSVGGPLTIPHLLHGNGQFFINYLMTRNRNALANNTALMPTQAERGGDFSQLSTPILDPLTGNPFPGNVIPRAASARKPRPCSGSTPCRISPKTPITITRSRLPAGWIRTTS